jgi:hypothetical protein
MTISQLRKRIKALGGKPYARLVRTDGTFGVPRKADLAAILAGLQASRNMLAASAREAAIHAAEAGLTWYDETYRTAMRRVMACCATETHRQVLQITRVRAIAVCRDSAGEADWCEWNNLYQVALATCKV